MEALVVQQAELHGRISRAVENLYKLGKEKITLGAISSRLASLERNWQKFQDNHDAILTHRTKDTANISYFKDEFYDVVEELYNVNKGTFLDLQAKLTPTTHGKNSGLDSTTVQSKPAGPVLPRINLPKFTGLYGEWAQFRDLFNSLVISNSSLSDVERLHYLKMSLSGEPFQLLRNIPTTAENFTRSWENLTKRYENVRLLVTSHIATLCSLRAVQSESASELKRLLNTSIDAIGALRNLKRPVERWDDWLVYVTVQRIDNQSRREWETQVSSHVDPPTFEELTTFLENRVRTLEALESQSKSRTSTATSQKVSSQRTPKMINSLHTTDSKSVVSSCSMCSGEHYIVSCPEFRKRSPTARREFVIAKGLCFNCLGRHSVSSCRSTKVCVNCQGKHHTMIHGASHQSMASTTSIASSSTPSQSGTTQEATDRVESSVVSHVAHSSSRTTTLLATALIRVYSEGACPCIARALLDQGSQVSFISESLTQKLRLTRNQSSIPICGIGAAHSRTARGTVQLKFSSGPSTTQQFQVKTLILPKLTSYIPPRWIHSRDWPQLDNLRLADPQYLSTEPIDVILGADIIAELLEEGVIKGATGTPVAQKTALGWILSGPSLSENNSPLNQPHRQSSLLCTVEKELPQLLQRFWEQEEPQPHKAQLTLEESNCETHFIQTHSRTPEGRYVVRLPFIDDVRTFGDSRPAAHRALTRIERRFITDSKLKESYIKFMSEYITLGHMKLVSPTDHSTEGYYLPHHGVLKESSTTTKLRVVFNGSQRTPLGTSLNDHLAIGPKLLPELSDVLLHWRMHRFVLSTDIEKMYRQILIHTDDHHFQRILWRQSHLDDINEYHLTTVTYGLRSAPFLALRTLQQLAHDEGEKFPLAAPILLNNSYVDDILTGADDIETLQTIQQQLIGLLTAGGFPLRKWTANSLQVLSALPDDWVAQSSTKLWHGMDEHHMLGLSWRPDTDSFIFHFKPLDSQSGITKRLVLSLISRLFDPLGWLSPLTISAKTFMQTLWLLGIGWDDELPDSHSQQWVSYYQGLSHLQYISIPRWTGYSLSTVLLELHGFADASERAYAAVVYLRTVSSDDTSQLRILLAKTRVSPVKQVSLPRLELCAAVLLARLVSRLKGFTTLQSASTHLWSDSTVTLAWIKAHPSRWTTFVANRTSEIQTRVPEAHWHHINGNDNPADCASRGISCQELIHHKLWWTGPTWLSATPQPTSTSTPDVECHNLPEQKVTTHIATSTQTVPHWDLLDNHSSLTKLLRITAWCRRVFLVYKEHGSSVSAHTQILTPEELDAALEYWIKTVQASSFGSDILALSNNDQLPRKSSLLKLSPFLDGHGLLRVGGRLKHSVLDYNERHPIILPRYSHFTTLIIRSTHLRSLHGGTQLTLGTIRRKYWILKGRSAVKSIIHNCVTCFRHKANTASQQMGQLPHIRSHPSRPFLHSGVDYAGPLALRTSPGRGRKSMKGYIAVFVCMATRAIHLEVVSDYSTDAFLAAFKRFTARRGICATITSDNGTNFTGADAQLRALFSAASKDFRHIANTLANDGTRWKFIPPGAPHFGGLWEAGVKSVKHHLRRVIGDSTLTFEELSTFLTQVEACLNSRPIQAISDDPDDFCALTPGHFLIGTALTTPPEPSLTDVSISRLTRWQLISQMRDIFWQRWSTEYLQGLLPMTKWQKQQPQIQVGDLVLIKNEIYPPTKWALARVLELCPGKDGQVRVVILKTQTSTLKRPVVKLCVLPRTTGNTNVPSSEHS